MILTEKEQKFLLEWEKQRNEKSRSTYFFIAGIRNGCILLTAILLSLTTGWYKRISFFSPGLMLAFCIACLLLLVFITLFTAAHTLEQKEQYYFELKVRLHTNKTTE